MVGRVGVEPRTNRSRAADDRRLFEPVDKVGDRLSCIRLLVAALRMKWPNSVGLGELSTTLEASRIGRTGRTPEELRRRACGHLAFVFAPHVQVWSGDDCS
jgi:hypothetical protein